MEFWRVNFTIPGVSILWGSSSPAISVKYYRRYREIPGVITIQLLSPEQKKWMMLESCELRYFLDVFIYVSILSPAVLARSHCGQFPHQGLETLGETLLGHVGGSRFKPLETRNIRNQKPSLK
jgi:hypothetical protein